MRVTPHNMCIHKNLFSNGNWDPKIRRSKRATEPWLLTSHSAHNRSSQETNVSTQSKALHWQPNLQQSRTHHRTTKRVYEDTKKLTQTRANWPQLWKTNLNQPSSVRTANVHILSISSTGIVRHIPQYGWLVGWLGSNGTFNTKHPAIYYLQYSLKEILPNI